MRKMWQVLLILWILLLLGAVLCSAGIIPDREPGALQYAAIALGIAAAVIQMRRN